MLASAAFADQLEEKEIPRVKKVLQKLVNKILVESRSAIQPFISLPLVRIMGGWVGLGGCYSNLADGLRTFT